jgi:pyrroline-5-carboxylate reductase
MSTSSPPQSDATARWTGRIALVGAGKMGGAMLDTWIEFGLDPARIAVIEPQPSASVTALARRGVLLNPAPATLRPEAVIIAVKPQSAAEAAATVAPLLSPATVVISIMAGRTLAFLGAALPPATAIVRAMPNLPATIGRGITVAVPNAAVSPAQREIANALLATIGAVEWIADEGLMDAVTAVSGSGPAYVFLLAETLARAGVAAGLPEGLAGQLARETVAGSGELLGQSLLSPTTLRENVTSPGGTTAAALAVLMANDGLFPLMEEAVAAAMQRGRELAG